jgi:hypothetical protein
MRTFGDSSATDDEPGGCLLVGKSGSGCVINKSSSRKLLDVFCIIIHAVMHQLKA